MPKNPGITMGNWTGGCNSLQTPDNIKPNQVSWLVNCAIRGGIVQNRPGYDHLASILGKKVQGGIIFIPKNSRPMMLIAVDGIIYRAKFPFKNGAFQRIEGLQFKDTAPIITFQRVLKSVKLNTDGGLTLIDPMPLVVIQDGTTKAGVFDGSVGQHSTAGTPFFGIPIGLWMAWTSSRLWVFNKSRGYVSDLANPDTFNENEYIAERSNFELPGDVTGAVETTDEKALLVFTTTTTTAFKSNIRDRTQWGTTPEFQKVILPSIGCVSGRSPVNQYGLTWWFSRAGFINLDAALYTSRTSQIRSVDGEMMRSKRILSPDQSTICTAFYENYLLCSVPAGGKHNEQTWVADQAPTGQAADGIGMSWAGIWTGTRPVTWMKTEYAGRERLYFVSYDATSKDGTNIHVWEAFKSDRRDNDGRISCQLESAMIAGTDIQRFRYAELDLCEILGPVEYSVYVGGRRGPWYLVGQSTLQAEIGSIGSSAQKIITKESILQAFKPQSRIVKSKEFNTQGLPCIGPESDELGGRDKALQILIEWRGRMGVKAIKIVSDPDPSADSGQCPTPETGPNIVLDSGESLT